MLSYLATKACTYAIKLIYISNCFALKLIVLFFFSPDIFIFCLFVCLFFKPQLFYLKNYLSEAGLFLNRTILKAFSFPFTFISKIICMLINC